MENQFQILLYYKYVDIADAEALRNSQLELCKQLELKGRIIVANEGINGTVEGTVENTEKYVQFMQQDERFADIKFKRSEGNGHAFPKLSVKVRQEIVGSKLDKWNINPHKITGKYLEADELHNWYERGEDFVVIDMRNNYEFDSGRFENSIQPNITNFRDLPAALPQLESLKDKKIITVCTGGVRCEKASGFLLANGFKEVYQLKDGIVTYMEKYPNKHFKGKLYVFDSRILMGFETESPEHEIVGRCVVCQQPCENYTNCDYDPCHKQLIACESCLEANNNMIYCSSECQHLQTELGDKARIHKLKRRGKPEIEVLHAANQ